MTRRTFVRRSRLEAPADEVYRWHARAGALERLSPPWTHAVVESRSGGIEDEGARVVLRVGPLRQRCWGPSTPGLCPAASFTTARSRALRRVGAHAPDAARG